MHKRNAMQKPYMELGPRAYEPEHIQVVLSEIGRTFPKYFQRFCPSIKTASKAFTAAISAWKKDAPAYEEFLALDSLEEYEADPGSFRTALKKECPIIRHCMNSSAKEMEKYKKDFNRSTGKDLLYTTINIVQFGMSHAADFNGKKHEKVDDVEELGLSALLEDDYIAYGVIGGGIKSLFLHSRYPHAFPNRSQQAIWALYFLTNKKDFGFSDDSEFLMIDTNEDHSVTQQNYRYPYDLFAYYALCIYKMLKEALAKKGLELEDEWRYVYLDAFLNHIAETHEADISVLKGTGEHGYKG
jgi:sulfur relay (sulfurtransferase) DsrF/TusC family protein